MNTNRKAALTPEDDVEIVKMFPRNPTDAFYRMVMDALNVDDQGLEGEALAQAATNAVVACKNEEDLDVLTTILKEIAAHGDINKLPIWSLDAEPKWTEHVNGAKQKYTDLESFVIGYSQEIGSAFDIWMDQAQQQKMFDLYQKGYRFKSKVFDFERDGDKDVFWSKVDRWKARMKELGWKDYDDEDNLDQREFILISVAKKASKESLRARPDYGEPGSKENPDFGDDLVKKAEVPEDMHPELNAFSELFNVNAPELKKNVGKSCAFKSSIEAMKTMEPRQLMLKKIPYVRLDVLDIVGVQKIYNGNIAYRVTSPIYDSVRFGFPAEPNEIQILSEVEASELRQKALAFVTYLASRDRTYKELLPIKDPRYQAVETPNTEITDQDKEILRGMGIKARLQRMLHRARQVKALNLTMPSAVLQQFRPDLLGEQVQYPEAQHQESGRLEPGHNDGNQTLERTQKGLSGVSPSEQLDGPPMRKELNLRGPSFTDNFYKAQDNLSPTSFHASKRADSDPLTPRVQFETMLKQVLATFTASAVGMFQSSQRPVPFDGQSGSHTVNLGEFAAGNSYDPSGKFNTYEIAVNRVKEMAEILKVDEIRESLDAAWAQAAVWCNDDGGFLYEIYASGDAFDPKTLDFSFKYITGKKGDLKLATAQETVPAKHSTASRDYTDFGPGFAVPDDVPTTFVDDSWDVDTCPSFINAPANQKLWIEHPDRDQREDQDPGMKRFTLTDADDRSQVIFETDDWDEMKRFISQKSASSKTADEGVQVFHSLEEWKRYCEQRGGRVVKKSPTWYVAEFNDGAEASYSFLEGNYQEGRYYPAT